MKRNIWKAGIMAVAGAGVLSASALTAGAEVPEELWDYETSVDEDGNLVYEFEELNVTVPASWDGKVAVGATDYGVFFSLKSIQDFYSGENSDPSAGELFAICGSEDYAFMTSAAYTKILGTSDDYIYYWSPVQGVPYDGCSQEVQTEWRELSEDLEWIEDHVEMTNSGTGHRMDVANGTQMYSTTAVNIRSIASISGKILGVVPRGGSVMATGSARDGWMPVYYQGIKGYMSEKYLSSTQVTSTYNPETAWSSAPSGNLNVGADSSSDTGSGASSDSSGSTGAESIVTPTVQLYTGSYRDSAIFEVMTLYDLPQVYDLEITNVSDTSFTFVVYLIDSITSETLETVTSGTAIYRGNGDEAVCLAPSGMDSELYFTFPDNHSTYPVVTDIAVSGLGVLEGKVMVNNCVPGYGFN